MSALVHPQQCQCRTAPHTQPGSLKKVFGGTKWEMTTYISLEGNINN